MIVLPTLVLAAAGAFAAPLPARVVDVQADDPRGGEPPELPFGIRGWGQGAARVAAPSASSFSLETPADRAVTVAQRISGATMAGDVVGFALAPGRTTAVYIADQEVAGRFELYSAPLDASAAPVKISTGLTFDGAEGVSAFRITPDGTRVVFLADPDGGPGQDDLYSVPIGGGSTPVRLNASGQRPVTAFGLAPNSATVVYFGVGTTGAFELFAATIGSAASGIQLSDVGSTNPAGSVVFATIGPDSARAVYAADPVTTGVFQWHSVSLAAAGPGTDATLSAGLEGVGLHAIRPDGARVAYTADENLAGVFELFEIPIAGGARIRLNPAMAGAGVRALEYSPDGSRIAYLADQNTSDVVEVYGAQSGAAGSGARVSNPMFGTQSADTLNVGPDNATVLFEADANVDETFELFHATLGSAAGSATLYPVSAPDNAGSFGDRGTPIIGDRAVFPLLGTTVDLIGVPFDGSAPARVINDELATGQTVRNAFLPPAATTLLMFGSGPDGATSTDRVWVASIARDLPQEQINATAGAGTIGVTGYAIDDGQAYAVYAQDQQTAGKIELFSRPLDSDADGVASPDDNCPFDANASQQPVVFAQTVFATGTHGFGWAQPTDARWVRGPLDQLDVYATNGSGTAVGAVAFTDETSPAPGSGLYYLFAPDCAGRSYQTAPGGEPARDLATFP
ncbi:MAG TPA: hypothetical protein VD788_00365 [Candidatus Polarisedimenticolaceae bacterium]|nr:hypothetical protein [Candidatus Polarisedimenticolaceae bacterium]